jgi:tRNA/rRNA methyltransferase
MSLHNCRIVLVRPKIAANIGATARVMRNMGLSDLMLVAPEADPADREARRLSTHGECVLDQARAVADLSDALAECIFVVGTSARTGGPYRRQSVFGPDHIMPLLVERMNAGTVALVFGPEPSGLTDEEVSRCHFLMHITTDETYPALNLAQSVAICTYELRNTWMQRAGSGKPPEPAAPFADQERMFRSLQKALEEIHFLYGEKAGPLMHALRHLIGRAGPTAMEVDLLFGLARQIRWFVKNSATKDTKEPEKKS